MNLDGKATRRARDETQGRDSVRNDLFFDVVAVQVDLHGLVGAQANDDLIVLANRQHFGLGGRTTRVNGEFENAVFRQGVSNGGREQRGGQQAGCGV